MPQSIAAEKAVLPAIRRAGLADAARLAALGARAYREAFGYLFEEAPLADYLEEEYGVHTLRELLQAPGQAIYMMELAGEAIGYVALKADAAHPLVDSCNCWQMQKLYLLQGQVGQGLGVQLLQWALTHCAPSAPATLWLEVADVNPRGKVFYAKQGFRAVGTVEKQFAGQWFGITIMRRDIAESEALCA